MAGPEKGVSRSVRVFVKIIVSEVNGWGEHRARPPAWPVIGPFIVISVVARGSRHLLPAERHGPNSEPQVDMSGSGSRDTEPLAQGDQGFAFMEAQF